MANETRRSASNGKPKSPDRPRSRRAAGKTADRSGAGRVHLVTGYPGFIGRRLVEALARRQPGARLLLLVQEKFEKQARRYASRIRSRGPAAEIEILVGDVVHLDLGLSGEEYRRLVEEVTDVHHLAAIYYLGVSSDRTRRVNVDGTRHVIELCRDMKRLRRINHMSTCYVAGDRAGVVAEDELEMGQRFRNAYEATKYDAEILARDAMSELPVSIYRPGVVVGDSRTGEIDRFDGPYYFGILLVTSPLSVPLPLPGDGSAPLNIVPVDFVVDAVLTLGEDPRAEGRTFHLVDPNPMSSRRVYELVGEKSGRKVPVMNLSYRFTERLMRLPVLEGLLRQQRQAVEYVNQMAFFNSRNTTELLEGTGVRCPPLESYVDRLIAYVRAYYKQRSEREEVEDPLDTPPPASRPLK